MSSDSNRLGRRSFLRTGSLSLAGAGLMAGRVNAVEAEPISPTPPPPNIVPAVRLPRSGFETPIVGVGCPYLARWLRGNHRDEIARVLRHAFDQGLRYFDSDQLYEADPPWERRSPRSATRRIRVAALGGRWHPEHGTAVRRREDPPHRALHARCSSRWASTRSRVPPRDRPIAAGAGTRRAGVSGFGAE